MKLIYFIALMVFAIFIIGCTKNYYEVVDGLYCLDQNKNSICDKDEKKPDNLYEFKSGFFCSDSNDNKKCDTEEANATKSVSNSTVNNTISSLVVNNSTPTKSSDKTTHEECLDKYDVVKGAVIYRYASWDPFLSDNDAIYKKGLEEDGLTVFADKFGTGTKDSHDASELMKECFEGVYSAEVASPPEFICSSNKDVLRKSYPAYNDVRQFAMECKNAKVV